LASCSISAIRAGYSSPALLRAGLRLGAVATFIAFGSNGLQTAVANGDTRTLSFHHLHTNEEITITFKRDGRYDADALKKLDWFMRDWRKDESVEMEPQLYDLLWEAYRSVEGKQPIQIVCGYRSSGTNEMLRNRSSGVAKGSLHTRGQAMDFYIPGVSLEELRNVGLRLQRGGVGFYPTSGSPFVHMDVGNVRHWPRMTHDQLVKVFPDGRTVHVGTDGQPLKNYALALADIEKRGGQVTPLGNIQLASATSARDEDGDAGVTMDNNGRTVSRGSNLFARLFGGGTADESQSSTPRTPALTARNSRPAPMPTTVATVATTSITRPETEEPQTTANIPLPRPAQRPTVLAEAMPLPKPAPVRIAKVETRNDPPVEIAPATAPMQVASADPIFTAKIADENVATQAMAYAGPAASNPVDRAKPMGQTPVRFSAPVLAPTLPSATPASAAAGDVTTITLSREELTTVIRTQRFHEPWLRAVMLTPSVTYGLTASPTISFDPRRLRDAMRKPTATVLMGFADDPHDGMTTASFSGRAVVFLATANFGQRTAALATTTGRGGN
jgi:uncharacterized protein YcbK (DUF882 family)